MNRITQITRKAQIARKTKETDISLTLNLDGSGNSSINTGIGFLDHMLSLFAFHGNFDLDLTCIGDLEVDSHHSIEDIAICLGKAVNTALSDKIGIQRYAYNYLPMDETLCRTVIDISGRAYCVYKAEFKRSQLGNLSSEDIREFFIAFSNHSNITIHSEILYGENDHHKAESLFKSLGRALSEAVKISGEKLMSTKGSL